MMNMGETIRMRRRALGLTQEQAAERLSVSAAAVSKWELGASYPDVTILPALARLLEIDLNTLMGFERSPDKETITRLLTGVNELAKTEGMDAAVRRAKGILREYPNCGTLLFGLAATLESRLMMSGADRTAYEPTLLGWYERAAESSDEESREAAAHLLAAKHLGRGDVDAAQRMMQRLPREPQMARWTLEVLLLLARKENAQVKTLLQNTLFRRAGDMQQILLRMIQVELDEDNDDAAQQLADLTQAFVHLLCMHPYVGHLAQLLPALHRKDAQASMTHIRAMLAAMETPWSPGECLPYAHADAKRSGHPSRDMLSGIIREMEESPEYAFVREEPEFAALLETYKGNRA